MISTVSTLELAGGFELVEADVGGLFCAFDVLTDAGIGVGACEFGADKQAYFQTT